MIDLYSTSSLSRVVGSLKRPAAFFLNQFFREVIVSDAEEIFFDVELDGKKRRLSPFVHPLREGKLVEGAGYATKSFKPAYVKDKRVHDAMRPFKRMAGETIGTGQTLTPMQRRQLALVSDLRDQQEMLTTRLEVMAAEILRTGKVTIKGEGFPEAILDFGRDANLTITLGAGSKWGDAGVKPITDLEDWGLEMLKKCGAKLTDVVMSADVWQTLRDTTEIEKKLDRRIQTADGASLFYGVAPETVQYKGTDGTYRYWIVADWYIDPVTGTETDLIPEGTLIGVAAGGLEGVRHFGAIKDEDAGLQPMESFTKSWTVQDPSARVLLMQSAPLLVPYRPNASFCAKVK